VLNAPKTLVPNAPNMVLLSNKLATNLAFAPNALTTLPLLAQPSSKHATLRHTASSTKLPNTDTACRKSLLELLALTTTNAVLTLTQSLATLTNALPLLAKSKPDKNRSVTLALWLTNATATSALPVFALDLLSAQIAAATTNANLDSTAIPLL
jgi:hypothetical protein